jgi:phosphoserine phosphatase
MTVRPAFTSVVLDADSTLCGVEGIDWLAALRGPAVAKEIASLTHAAMNGEIALDAVYGRRLALIRPKRDEVARLAGAYIDTLEPNARGVIAALRDANVDVHVVSSGLRQALEPVVALIGLDARHLHAVSIRFDARGDYAGYDDTSALTRANGKPSLLGELSLSAPVLAVGDGATDLAMRSAADCFAAFTGFVRRESVVNQADLELGSFTQLRNLVLDRDGRE